MDAVNAGCNDGDNGDNSDDSGGNSNIMHAATEENRNVEKTMASVMSPTITDDDNDDEDDDDDYKGNIPFFEGSATGVAVTASTATSTTAASCSSINNNNKNKNKSQTNRNVGGSIYEVTASSELDDDHYDEADNDIDDDDEEEDSHFNYGDWTTDDLDADMLSTGGDIGETDDGASGSCGGNNRLYGLSAPSASATTSSSTTALYHPPMDANSAYHDADVDVKYPPSEMLLRPPATSEMRYNYNYNRNVDNGSGTNSSRTRHSDNAYHQQHQQPNQQHPHQLQQPPHQHRHQSHYHQLPPHHPHHPMHHQQQQPHRHHPPHSHHMPYAPHMAGVGGGNPYCVPPPHGFHPHANMWYPNAPYGTSGGGGGSGTYYGSAAAQFGGHRYLPYGSHHRYAQDMLQLSNSGREARNRAEKNRRDKLNGSIQELSTMVPHVAESPRRVDKTAVLRFAAHGLRLQYVFGDTLNVPGRPNLTDSLMKLLDSFFITLTCHGQIVLISAGIEQHLGHCQADLYGQNILHITHPEDHAMLRQQLIPTDLESLFDIPPTMHESCGGGLGGVIGCEDMLADDSSESRSRSSAEEDYIDRRLREDKRNFTVRLARAGPRSEPTAYELVKFEGSFRRSDAAPRGLKTSSYPASLQLLRRSRGREDSALPLHTISGNDIVLIAIARIIRPPKVISRMVENTLQYKTRHLIDGRIIDCDQRIGLVAGYMTDEVRNLSPFTFMHQDDVRWVIVALRQMYDCSSSYGESTYRLLTRNGNFIYLQSMGYLEVDKDTNQVRSFICINTLLDEDEGRRRVQEMKRKFSVIIDTQIPQTSIDAPASDNPQQLEKAVLCLIHNLQKSSASTSSDGDDEEVYEATTSHLRGGKPTMASASVSAYTSGRGIKTPPLALVPPETASVKTSISKSVSVVNVTAAKSFRTRVRSPSSSSCVDDERYDLNFANSPPQTQCTCRLGEVDDAGGGGGRSDGRDGGNVEHDCKYCEALAIQRMADGATETATTTGRGTGTKRTSCSENSDEMVAQPKRRLKSTDFEEVLSSSLIRIGRQLDQQLNAAMELRDQGNKYEVPNASQRIDEIIEEHQKQSELYVNIKSEYEVQLQHNKDNEPPHTTKSNINTIGSNSSNTNSIANTIANDELSRRSASTSNNNQSDLRPR